MKRGKTGKHCRIRAVHERCRGCLVGVLIEARERGILLDAAAVVDDLQRKAGFWLSDDLRLMVVGRQ